MAKSYRKNLPKKRAGDISSKRMYTLKEQEDRVPENVKFQRKVDAWRLANPVQRSLPEDEK